MVGVTCGNIPSQKHSLVLVSKLFMLVLLKLCANSFQEVFILVELNKKIRPTVSCLVWPKTVHFRSDRPLSRDLLLRRLRILHFGPNCFIRKSLWKRASHGLGFAFLSGFAKKNCRGIFPIMCQIRFFIHFQKFYFEPKSGSKREFGRLVEN